MVAFDPAYGKITHEYRVTVRTGDLRFYTEWYIERHARDVLTSLRAAYPHGEITLQKRRVQGDVGTVE